MSDKDRKKKDGQNKDKKTHRMREAVSARHDGSNSETNRQTQGQYD